MAKAFCCGLTILLLVSLAACRSYVYLVPAKTSCFIFEANAEMQTIMASVESDQFSGSVFIEAYYSSDPRTSLSRQTVEKSGDGISFSTARAGGYHICFTYASDELVPLKASISISSTMDLDYNSAASSASGASASEQAKALDLLAPLVEQTTQESGYLLNRQQEFDGTVYSTHNRVLIFTLLNVIIVIGAGGWQLFYIRKFLKDKKVV